MNLTRILNFVFCTSITLLPKRFRFKAAFFISKKLFPLVKRTSTFAGMLNQNKFDGPEETALMLLLDTLTAKKIEYNLDLQVTGAEELSAAVETGKGVMYISVHGLSRVSAAFLIKNGYDPHFISAVPEVTVSGMATCVNGILPGPNSLLKIAGLLKKGFFIGSMTDIYPVPGRYIEMPTPNGPLIVTTPIFKIAQHTNAGIIFSKVYIAGGKVHLKITAPTVTEQHNEVMLANEFIAFLNDGALNTTCIKNLEGAFDNEPLAAVS